MKFIGPNRNSLLRISIASVFIIFLGGCMTLKDEYSFRVEGEDSAPFSDLEITLSGDLDRGNLERIISTLENQVRSDPNDALVWSRLSSNLILLGTAFGESRSEKMKLFKLASASAVESMKRSNPEIADSLFSGKRIWELAPLISERDMEASLFWVTSVLYTFREGMRQPQPIFNVKWIRRAELMLKRMEEIDPHWSGGAVLFSMALIYHAIPEAIGGDAELAQEYLERAVSASDQWMLARWGRATYFLIPEGRLAEAREDLRYVESLEVEDDATESILWRRYFHGDAEELLKSL